MPPTPGDEKKRCSLLLFVATPTEEEGLEKAAEKHGLPFEKYREAELGEYRWLGPVGNETVIAVSPSRREGRVVMGSIGRLGSAAKAMRFQRVTEAEHIVQIGMAFGVSPETQSLGDVLVSTSLIPYDSRVVKPDPEGRKEYLVDYSRIRPEPARVSMVELFSRERRRGGRAFSVHVGPILSGAAVIHTARFRRELVLAVPDGSAVVGGEMEGVGLLAASVSDNDPIWCVVKGISDFADEDRDRVIQGSRPVACFNSADFVLSALHNNTRRTVQGVQA